MSDEVRIAPLLSLAVPRDLTAQASDSSIKITWAPTTTRTDGSRYDGFVGYNLYRGTEKGRYDDLPLNKEPLRTNSYKDTTAANNRTYYYMVRSVDSPALPWKESLDSDEVSATPRDLTPPARPTGLTVVPGVGRAFLTWNENKEPDLAGYHVYRSTVSGKAYVRLTDKVLTRTTFSDETAKQGAVYYYKITALDRAGNESAGSEEKMASIEKLR
jgi:fibronectin type 3 domain-containing protein